MTSAITYISVVFVWKNREKRNRKKRKIHHFAECLSQNTRQRSLHMSASQPLCRVLKYWHSAKIWTFTECHCLDTRQTRHVEVPWRGDFAECPSRTLGKVRNFAECLPLDTRQTAGPGWSHVASLPSIRALGKTFAECPYYDTRQSKLCRGNLCRVLHSAKTLPSVIYPLPSVSDTRQTLVFR